MAFKIVLFLAGLQKIDPQYYQAARMDETPPSRVFFRITMPLLSLYLLDGNHCIGHSRL